MKILFIAVLFLSGVNQDKTTVKVIYDGYYEGIYSFTTITDDEDDFGETLEFDNVSDELLKKYDLNSETFVDEEFTITYIKEIDDDGDYKFITYKLIDIKKTNN